VRRVELPVELRLEKKKRVSSEADLLGRLLLVLMWRRNLARVRL